MVDTERIYGQTGEVGKDGLLTPEQSEILNRLQEKAAVASIDYLDRMTDDQEYPLVAMATGIGKGNIIHRVIEKQMRRKPDSKVLLIAGTKLTLVRQTHEALSGYQQQNKEDVFDYVESEEDDEIINETMSAENDPLEDQKSFLYKTGKLGQEDANVHVATIQGIQSSIARNNLNPDDYDFVVIDEVHNIGTTRRKATIDQFKKKVGFTATPLRYSGRMKTPEQYGFKVIESLPLSEAQQLRLLPPLVGIQIDTTSVLEDKIPTTLTGLIDYKKLEKLLKDSPNLRPYIADRLANIISQDGKNYKTVIAVNFVWEAEELAELLKDKGIKVGIAVNQQAARALDSEKIPAFDSIERYKLPESNDKSLQVLISPYVLGEGFDAPATEVLVWASPTDSDLRYTQYTGRLARRAEGKRFGVIVDCLYQTSQYNWSYNMGMWMKGHVRTLDNGLLYLGPETDIESLKSLPQVESFTRESAKKSLEELQKEDLLEVQETDFPITNSNFRSIFIGTWRKLHTVAQQILEQERKQNPDVVVRRISGSSIVSAATDRDRFINAMKLKGIRLKVDVTSISDTDLPITRRKLKSLFVGGSEKIISIADKVREELLGEHPGLVTTRQESKAGRIIPVCTDGNLFIQKMIENGARLKPQDAQSITTDNFIINQRTLRDSFLGNMHLYGLADAVISEIEATNPNWMGNSTAPGRKSFKMLIGYEAQDYFFKRMQEKGARLRSEELLTTLNPTDFVVTSVTLSSMFSGGHSKLNPIARSVLEELKRENSSLVSDRLVKVGRNRTGGTSLVQVAADRERFIQEMIKRGLRLKPPK